MKAQNEVSSHNLVASDSSAVVRGSPAERQSANISDSGTNQKGRISDDCQSLDRRTTSARFGRAMIRDDQKLRATLDRIRYFHEQVEKIRQVETNPENYRASAGGFLAEIDRMNLEVREYLSLHPAEVNQAV